MFTFGGIGYLLVVTISTPPAPAGKDDAASDTSSAVADVAHTVDESTDDVAERVHDEIEERPWLRRIAQLGWLAKGVVYGSLGWAAIEVARGQTAADDVEYTGIVRSLASGGWSRMLLVLIAVGLVFYILFRIASIALIDDNDLDAWAHRIGYGASGVTYIAVSWAAANAAIRGPLPEDGEGTVERLSRSLLETTPGRIALVIGGIVAFGVAGYFVFKGATRRFMSQIDKRNAGATELSTIEYSGAVGWVGRGLTVAFVAAFVTWSAIDADPNDARGLDSSMNRIANEQTWGEIAVLAVGVALLIYAFFCILSARHRRLAWENNPEPACDPDPAGKPSKEGAR